MPHSRETLLIEERMILDTQLAFDKIQWEQDVVKVRQKRVDCLSKYFPEVDINQQAEQDIDLYTAVKRMIFDFYAERLRKAKGNKAKVDDYEYEESPYGQYINFDRSMADDTMLIQLRKLVLRIERKQKPVY